MINFSEKYNRKNFENFLEQFLPDDLIKTNEELKLNDNNIYFEKAILLGEVKSLKDLVIIEIQRKKSEKSRISITKELFKFLELHSYSQALIVTFSEREGHYRFSLIYSELNWVTENKVKRSFSNPKRLSFILGDGAKLHTPHNKLNTKVLNYKDLFDRFNIEVVNDEFFENYKKLFLNLKNKLEKDTIFNKFLKDKKISSDFFSKRLLGQIVFCYFLQKKRWLGVVEEKKFGTGDKNYLRNIFNFYEKKKKNFFNEFLEFFFYEGLNNLNENNFVKSINIKVPYIGGGLFEYFDGYDWKNETLNIPNSFFSNEKKDGILDIFDLYNFTVDEHEDYDIELAVDPEMLGRVFENLLPENIRKGGGSYYTPRVIVNYMCENSLSHYLYKKFHNLLKFNEINDFIKNKNFNISKEKNLISNAEKIDDALKNLKICDPSIGSGAFAVAFVNLISRLRLLLIKYVSRKYKNNLYSFKRNCIQNSIYGVDIDESAVEIAKLRLWLTLIVEKEDYENTESLPNLDFQLIQGNSLINEVEGYNFHYLDIKDKDFQFELIPNDVWDDFSKIKEKFINLKKKYLDIKSYNNKKKLKSEIEDLLPRIAELAFSLGGEWKKKSVTNYEVFKKIHLSKNFFLWKLYFIEIFQDQPGFDILVGNPPYIGEKGNSSKFQEVRNASSLKKFYQRKMDYYYFFFHLALDLLKDNGILNFITTSYFTTSTAGKNLRDDIKSRGSFLELIDFNELKIFKSAQGQHNMITTIIKNIKKDSCKTIQTSKKGHVSQDQLKSILYDNDPDTLYKYLDSDKIFEGNDNYIRLSGNIDSGKNIENDIFHKMLLNSNQLSNFFDVDLGLQSGIDKVTQRHIKNYQFIKTNDFDNGVYVISDNEYNNLNLSKTEKNICKKMYKNSNINKYFVNKKTDKFIIYLTRDLEIKDYPNIKKHIFKYEKLIKKRSEDRGEIQAALKLGKWWVLYSAKSKITFEGNKIVCPQRSNLNTFAYCDFDFYANRDVYYIRNKNNSSHDLKALCAILNSKLFYFWLLRKGKLKGSSLELYSRPLSEIPIKIFDDVEMNYLSELVKNILQDSDSKKIMENDKKINDKINKLYNLSSSEIKYIDNIYKKAT